MTEIERMLSNTLIVLEQDLQKRQNKHEQALIYLQNLLSSQESTLQNLQLQIRNLSDQYQETAQYWQKLSITQKQLDLLLTHINSRLNK